MPKRSHPVVQVTLDTTVYEAASLMREHDAHNVILSGDGHQPVKITEGDIVRHVIALGLDPSIFTIGDIASCHQAPPGKH